MRQMSILVADDDVLVCRMLAGSLQELGHSVDVVHTSADAVRAAARQTYDIALLDIHFPDCDDLGTLQRIRTCAPRTDVIMVTGDSEDLSVVSEAIRLGAFDYCPKPVRIDDIRIRVTRAAQMRELRRTSARAVGELARGREFDDIIAVSRALRSVVEDARALAPFDTPVLITGETGTGKELIARSLHYGGPRRDRPFVPVNCAAIPAELTASELFGHRRGAFTGAHRDAPGAFGQAGEGTLFLDEIGDMGLAAQASLLRVLEHRVYRPVGGSETSTAARVVLATNRDLEACIESGRFRSDLYYRVSRSRLAVPPLRQRPEDIPALAEAFLESLDRRIGRGIRSIASDAHRVLRAHRWPGNVRELRNEIEQAYIRARGAAISVQDLSMEVRSPGRDLLSAVEPCSIERTRMRELTRALERTGGNVSRAARILGVHRNTATRWLKRLSVNG